MSISSLTQEYKGNLMLNANISGGSGHLLDNEEEDVEIFSGIYNINMKTGYFIFNKSSTGIMFGYSWDRENEYPPWDDSIKVVNLLNSYDIGPYYKGYFKLLKDFYFTLNVSSFYRFTSFKKSFPDGEYDSYYKSRENALYLSFLPGMSYDFNEKFSVEFELGFFDAYVKFKSVSDFPISNEETQQVIYGTSSSLNEFDLHDILFGFTYRIKLN